MRIVGLEHDLFHADAVPQGEPDGIVEHAPVDPVADVAGRRAREPAVQVAVDRSLFPDAVEPFQDERHPTDLTFTQCHPQVVEPLQHTAGEPVCERMGRTLVGQGE